MAITECHLGINVFLKSCILNVFPQSGDLNSVFKIWIIMLQVALPFTIKVIQNQ